VADDRPEAFQADLSQAYVLMSVQVRTKGALAVVQMYQLEPI
jgi:hypothetical protein